MKQWVLSVAGIAILSVLADVVLPSGQTRKYVKTVVNVVVTVVLAQPILAFCINPDFSFSEISVQDKYLQYVDTREETVAEELQMCLEEAGFVSPTVSFDDSAQLFVVTLLEKRTEESSSKAYEAAERCKCVNRVKFYWSSSGRT